MAKVKVKELVAPLYEATRLLTKLKPQPTSELRFTSFCNQPSHVGESKQSDVIYWVDDMESEDIHVRCKCCGDLTMDMIQNPATVEIKPVNESVVQVEIKPTNEPVELVNSLPIDEITIDQKLQARMEKEPDPAVVAEYAELMRDGVIFPPVVIFYDGETRLLAEGFHRIEAAKQAGFTSISVTVIEGNERAAMLHSLGSNADHGKRRTNADKRYVVETMLKDDQWSAWSDREIGERCKVTHPFVAGIRKSLIPVSLETLPVSEVTKERTFTTKHGTTATMKTGNIGKKQEPVKPTVLMKPTAPTTVSDESEFVTNAEMNNLSFGMRDNVCELIETHNIPAEYHVELIEAAEGWAVNSDASNREGTSVAVKGFIWWDEKSGALAKRRIRVGEEAKNKKLLKKFGEYPFETTTFHFLENLRVGNSGPMADLKRCAEHFDSLDRERLERFKKILADIRQAHNEGMDELESSIDALLRSVEKDITPTDKLLTNT